MRWALVLLTLALLGLLLWNQHRIDSHERALGELAAEIAGRPVTIKCQGLGSALLDVTNLAGEVIFDHSGAPPDEATLRRDVCRDLRRFATERSAPSFDCVIRLARCDRDTAKLAYSVHVFTHEAWHLRGVANEAVTECFALQTTALMARRMGATQEQARAIARWNLQHAYPSLPAEYRTSDCRDGGPLDLHPETSEWP